MSEFSVDGIVRGLERASDEMKRDVGQLIAPAADRMLSALVARYPRGRKDHPGRPHMEDDISIRSLPAQSHLLPARRVRGPRLGGIWQDGSVERFDVTRKNARRGRMPAAAPGFFERTAVQIRAQMLQQAQNILDRPREIPTTLGGGLI